MNPRFHSVPPNTRAQNAASALVISAFTLVSWIVGPLMVIAAIYLALQ